MKYISVKYKGINEKNNWTHPSTIHPYTTYDFWEGLLPSAASQSNIFYFWHFIYFFLSFHFFFSLANFSFSFFVLYVFSFLFFSFCQFAYVIYHFIFFLLNPRGKFCVIFVKIFYLNNTFLVKTYYPAALLQGKHVLEHTILKKSELTVHLGISLTWYVQYACYMTDFFFAYAWLWSVSKTWYETSIYLLRKHCVAKVISKTFYIFI